MDAYFNDAINDSLDNGKWKHARKLINQALCKFPDDHWLLARLALTYYEEYEYEKAKSIAEKALEIAPHCPLVIWEYAGSLSMLPGREKDAIKEYQKITRKKLNNLAYGPCGEGISAARTYIADSYYRIGCCYEDLGHVAKARIYLLKHLEKRGPGCRSLYPINDVRRQLKNL